MKVTEVPMFFKNGERIDINYKNKDELFNELIK